MGMPRTLRVQYDNRTAQSERPHARGRGDRDPDARVCDMGPSARNTSPRPEKHMPCEPLTASADNIPPTPPTRMPRASRRYDARASQRPSVNGGPSLRGSWRGITRRLPIRVIFAMSAGGESLGRGGQPNTWQKCFLGDLNVFRAPRGPHSLLIFDVETVI